MLKKMIPLLLIFAACSTPPPAPQVVPESATPSVPGEGVSHTVRVTARTLNVRRDATTTSPVIGQVKRGQQLTLVVEENGWSQVKLASGAVGWVSSDHVSDRPLKPGCESEYSFVKAPLASFSETGPHGLVVVDATVNAKGEVTATKLISNSTADPAMAEKAEQEIRSARFRPPYRGCVPRSFIFTYKRSF